jgi:DNA-binding GntR family transcriptional regulator
MRPGVTYSAPQLAEQFGVSPTPVREAMLDLVKEGLVATIRNKGFRVVELSDRELDEITELRLMLEVPTTRRIVETAVSQGVLDRLRDLAGRIERAGGRRDFVEHHRLDMEFHELLLTQGGNAQLVGTVMALRRRARLTGIAELADRDQLAVTLHEHAELVDLIEAGDADAAEALMARHIGHVRAEWATGTSD